MSDSLWPHGLQHARLPHPSLSPGACSNSCPLIWWCYPTISINDDQKHSEDKILLQGAHLMSFSVNWWFYVTVCFDSLLFIFSVFTVGFAFWLPWGLHKTSYRYYSIFKCGNSLTQLLAQILLSYYLPSAHFMFLMFKFTFF